MKWLLNLRTGAKLFLAFGLMIVFLAIVIVTAYMSITAIRTAQRTLFEQDFTTATDLLTLEINQNAVRASVLAMMSVTMVLHAVQTQSVDILLAFCLMIGGTIGAQFGAGAGRHLRGEQLRGLMALLILAVAARFGATLVMPPADLFSMAVLGR